MSTHVRDLSRPIIRFVTINNTPWYIASDLARALGVSNGPQWSRRAPAQDLLTVGVPTGGATLSVRLLNLVGFLKLALASTTRAARALRDRITLDDIRSEDPARCLPDCRLVEWDRTQIAHRASAGPEEAPTANLEIE